VKKYLIYLTNDLIRRHHFKDLVERMSANSNANIREFIKFDLESDALSPSKMTSEAIGRILGSLENMDVQLSKEELFKGVHFSGDPSETFRELAANCLAAIIFDRLKPTGDTIKYIPPFE
jgi:hypothetical protein